MVSCKLAGRMGNWLFQVSNVYAYARKHGYDWVIPHDKYDDVFTNIPYGTMDETGATIYQERGHQFQQLPTKDNIIFHGYYQCFKYFEHYREDILKLFGFQYKLNKGVTSIHVRRGDYVHWQEAFPLCTREYYVKAIQAMTDNCFYDFLIFGEDGETYDWCKENFKGIEGNFSYQPIGTPFGDMQRMSCCENQIISNSTFSVWAAWANRNPNKYVIAPDKLNNWYGKKSRINTKDVYPDEWIGIKF